MSEASLQQSNDFYSVPEFFFSLSDYNLKADLIYWPSMCKHAMNLILFFLVCLKRNRQLITRTTTCSNLLFSPETYKTTESDLSGNRPTFIHETSSGIYKEVPLYVAFFLCLAKTLNKTGWLHFSAGLGSFFDLRKYINFVVKFEL